MRACATTSVSSNTQAVLGSPNGADDVLTAASALVYGRLEPQVVAPDDPSWLGVDELLDQPHRIGRLVRVAAGRFDSDDWGLVVAQVTREAVSVLVTVAVHMWATQRRLFDLSAANVALRDGPDGVRVGLRRVSLAVLPTDDLARLDGDEPVDVLDETKLFDRLLQRVLGEPLPLGVAPTGPADQVAAVATVIATVRRTMRSGQRHLWGNAALAVASTLTHASHTIGARADQDRAAILAARPDLARTVELVTVPASASASATDAAGEITFPLRRTCCLLVKLPGADQCGTCSLRDRAYCLDLMTTWARRERDAYGCEGLGGASGTSSTTASGKHHHQSSPGS